MKNPAMLDATKIHGHHSSEYAVMADTMDEFCTASRRNGTGRCRCTLVLASRNSSAYLPESDRWDATEILSWNSKLMDNRWRVSVQSRGQRMTPGFINMSFYRQACADHVCIELRGVMTYYQTSYSTQPGQPSMHDPCGPMR